MATSGSVSTSSWISNYGYSRYVTVSWSRKSIDVEKQTTTISWTLTSGGSYTGHVMSGPFYVYIDNKEVYYSESRIKLYPNETLASGTTTLQHNTDGTKAFTIQVGAAIYSGSIKNTGSASFSLDLVGKATVTSAPNFTDIDNPTFTYSNPVGNNLESLWAAISLTGENPDIPYRSISRTGTSYTFTLSDAERKVLRAATQGSNTRKVRFYLRSVVNGNYYFSWKEVNFTVVNANPTLSGTVVDVNATTKALTGDEVTLIRYHSTAYAQFSAVAYKEATIRTHVIEHNGGITSSNEKTIPNVESNVFTFIASDSRGNTASQTVVSPMIDYIRPTANIDQTELMSPEGNYTLKVSGNYFNDTFGYTDAAQANTIQLKYRYKVHGEEWGTGTWFDLIPESITNNTYSSEAQFTLDYRTTYVFQVRIIDKLNTVDSAETIVRSLPVFHWSGDDFVFEVPVTFNAGFSGEGTGGGSTGGSTPSEPCAIQNGKYDGDLQITGDLWLKNDTNYGNTIYFGDKSYLYMSEASDDIFTIKATRINLNANSVQVNGTEIGSSTGSTEGVTTGTWTPTLTTSAAVSSYSVQQGWYSWVGDVITIGWQLKATVKNGYNSYEVAIGGCPFLPNYSAFGGGVAHNVAFVAGYNFEGWCLETDGRITLRGQPCNNTTMTNLNITSYAYYPTGSSSQVMTLAGTICLTASGVG